MKRWFQRLSISEKLRLIITLACVLVIVLTVAVFVGYDWFSFRRDIARVVSVRAEIIAANSSGALAFRSATDATAVLTSLQKDGQTVKAVVFDEKGEMFASFPTGATAAPDEIRRVERVEREFRGRYLLVWAPIEQGSSRLGSLYLCTSLSELNVRLRLHLLIAVMVMGASIGVAYGISRSLQRIISAPVLALAETARLVTETKDYSRRASPRSADEIGALTEDFNAMLARMQEREAALLESDARKSAVLMSALDAIITIDSAGWVVEFNPAAERIFGHTHAQAKGRELAELIIPSELRERHRQGLARALSGGSGVMLGRRMEMPAQRANGEIFPAEISITRVGIGERPMFTGFLRDITERKQAERTLRHSEERFRSLVVASANIVWSTDASGQVTDPLPSWQLFTGQSDFEILGEGWLQPVHPEERTPILASWRQAVQSRAHFEVEFRLRRVDGVYRTFAVRGVPVLNPDTSVREWIGTAADISERREAAERLQRSAERLAILNRIVRTISSNLDLDEVFDEFAREMRGLFEFDRTSIVAVHPERNEWEIVQQWSKSPTAVGKGTRGELKNSAIGWVFRQRRPHLENDVSDAWSDAEFVRRAAVRSRALFPLTLHGATIGIFSVSSAQPHAFSPDTLEFLQALADQLSVAVQNARLYGQIQQHSAALERHVAERTTQLEAANRELEAFTYSVSHDLRAPLRGMAGFSQILAEEYAASLPAEAVRYLGLIQSGARKMGQLIDELLAFSKLGRHALKIGLVDMEQLFRDVVAEHEPERKGRRIEITIGKMTPAEADPALLRQALTNLVSNALKYSRNRDPAVIEIGEKRVAEDKEPIYFVRDNGSGFDMKYAPKLFQVFQRLHRSEDFEGTGVGLAIVARVVERHGGRVWAEAAPDVGATFFFTLKTS
jgi:PAS domain S-box-containing protein